MKRLLTLLTFLCIAPTASLAQLGAYAGFTTSKLNVPNTSRTNGGTFGVYYDATHLPLINFGLDLRGTVLTSDNITKVKSITVGPRAVVHLPAIPLRPYAEFLVGGASVQTGQGVAYTNKDGLDAGFALGADLRVLPWIDWRVLDYSYSRLDARVGTNSNSLTTGIVLRIPRT